MENDGAILLSNWYDIRVCLNFEGKGIVNQWILSCKHSFSSPIVPKNGQEEIPLSHWSRGRNIAWTLLCCYTSHRKGLGLFWGEMNEARTDVHDTWHAPVYIHIHIHIYIYIPVYMSSLYVGIYYDILIIITISIITIITVIVMILIVIVVIRIMIIIYKNKNNKYNNVSPYMLSPNVLGDLHDPQIQNLFIILDIIKFHMKTQRFSSNSPTFSSPWPVWPGLVLSICCGRCLKRKRLAMAGQHWSHRALSPKRLYRGSLAANQFCGVAGVRLGHGHYSSGAETFVKERFLSRYDSMMNVTLAIIILKRYNLYDSVVLSNYISIIKPIPSHYY